MRISEYSDEDLLEEVKHRGMKIEIWDNVLCKPIHAGYFLDEQDFKELQIKIGGVTFDVK